MNPYKVLGLKKNCSQPQIKKAYRDLSKSKHPDVGGNAEEFVEIQSAYDILSDEVTRKKYDETGEVSNNTVPIKSAARNLLVGIWDQLVEMEFKVERWVKLPDALLIKLKDIKKDMERKRSQCTENIVHYRKIRDRIIYNGDENDFLKLTLEHKISSTETNITIYSRKIDEIEYAEKLAKDYSYDSEFENKHDYASKTIGDNLAKSFLLS